uniref:RING-type domain-containing protein n=1 Tax=Strongyloides venezuelensis TaxID=75913 RepID=A0A0K0FC01_STRVS
MPILCSICKLPYTPYGDEHSPYLTACKQLVGRSCMLKLYATQSHNNISCNKCFEKLCEHDCYPINDRPIEVINLLTDSTLKIDKNDSYVIEQYVTNNINNDPLFLKKLTININGHINLFDIHMGYIFIVGYSSKNIQFLKAYKMDNRKLCYNGKLRSTKCTSFAINKYNTKLFEITLGYDDGVIWYKKFTSKFTSPSKMQTFNYFVEKIYSISYVDEGVFVYSGGRCIRHFNSWSNNCFFEGFFGNNVTKYYNIINIKYFTDDVIFGVVDDKIYVFKKEQPAYLLCCETKSKIINYIIDSTCNRIHVFYNKYNVANNQRWYSLYYVIYQIIEENTKFDDIKLKKIHTAIPIRRFEYDNDNILSVPLKEISSNINNGERLMLYSFIPNIKSNTFKSISVNGKFNASEDEKELNINDCLGFFCLDNLNEILPGVKKITTCFVLHNKIRIFDLYCLSRK